MQYAISIFPVKVNCLVYNYHGTHYAPWAYIPNRKLSTDIELKLNNYDNTAACI